MLQYAVTIRLCDNLQITANTRFTLPQSSAGCATERKNNVDPCLRSQTINIHVTKGQ